MLDSVDTEPPATITERKHRHDFCHSSSRAITVMLLKKQLNWPQMNIDFFNRWCVESPLNPSTEKNPIKSDRKESKDNNTFNENSRYSQLHYSLLESMLERTSLQNQLLLLQLAFIICVWLARNHSWKNIVRKKFELKQARALDYFVYLFSS